MRVLPAEQWQALRLKALACGAFATPRLIAWTIAGSCLAPVLVSYQQSRSIVSGVIDIYARCRRCVPCMRYRQSVFVARGLAEYEAAPKTWLGTLTFSPLTRQQLSGPFYVMDPSPTEKARLQLTWANGHLTRYLKRLRKAGLSIRYLAVPERHIDGWVHFHLLIHGDVSWRSLATPWTAGFSRFNVLHDAKAVKYVAKYLHKTREGRVRCSLGYGLRSNSTPLGIDTPVGSGVKIRLLKKQTCLSF